MAILAMCIFCGSEIARKEILMGCGNVCVSGKYEGLYFIDNDDLHIYRPIDGDEDELKLLRDISFEDLCFWEYSDIDTQWWEGNVIAELQNSMQKKFPSFTPCNKWTNGGQRAVLQNQLFYVALEDNEWSLAVELIQKEAPWPQSYDGLQHKHYQRYLAGIRDTLFEQFESLGIYTGPWTSKTIHRSDVTV